MENDYYIVDQNNSDADINTVFGNYHLPLAKLTKLQMQQWYVEHGYEEIMNHTWFCYKPFLGKPCGTCNPCKYTIEEGLTNRFSKYALFRNKFYSTKFGVQFKKVAKGTVLRLQHLFKN